MRPASSSCSKSPAGCPAACGHPDRHVLLQFLAARHLLRAHGAAGQHHGLLGAAEHIPSAAPRDPRVFTGMWSGLAFGVSVLTKENAIFFAPTIFYLLIRRLKGDPNRHFTTMFWLFAASASVSIYFLFATLKNELLPSSFQFSVSHAPAGHVSLVYEMWYQLHRNQGTLFSHGSFLYTMWLPKDPFLMVGGTVAMLVCLYLGCREQETEPRSPGRRHAGLRDRLLPGPRQRDPRLLRHTADPDVRAVHRLRRRPGAAADLRSRCPGRHPGTGRSAAAAPDRRISADPRPEGPAASVRRLLPSADIPAAGTDFLDPAQRSCRRQDHLRR